MILDLLISSLSNLFVFALHLSETSSFPPPLSAKRERECLEKAKKGDEEAKNELIEHNLRLVAHIIKKYYSSNAPQDDLISIGTIGLIKAVNTFNADKGTRLATYAARCVENEILMYFRAQKKTAQDVSVNEPIDTDSEGNPLTLMDIISTEDEIVEDIYKMSMLKKLSKLISEMPASREKTIILLRYGLDGNKPMTQLEVSKKLKISRSYVSRIEKKVLSDFRKKLE
ncbi:MAG: RNA polymerase sporulation sigma factor SigK [Ruminococcus sp.]|nr:RNA polymerase sporulation sigma factor SigK [Candidatus Copronaster equi]